MSERFGLAEADARELAEGLGSAQDVGLASDTEKDLDSLRFLITLPPDERARWLRRLRWVRTADRLAESERLHPAGARFSDLVDAWALARRGRRLPRGHRDAVLIREIRSELRGDAAALAAWTGYLEALDEYTWRDLRIETLAEHDRMLDRLSGNLFALVPYLADEQRTTIRAFGRLDQFYNNLRDLAEDGSDHLCYFPREVLARFHLSVRDFYAGTVLSRPGWPALVRFWLEQYLPKLREAARPFLMERRLHPSVVAMRDECLGRYARILFQYRSCGYDYVQFARRYWHRGI